MIKSYSMLNSMGFQKILKKHDKVTGIISMKATLAKVDAAPFNNFKKLDPIIAEIGSCISSILNIQVAKLIIITSSNREGLYQDSD